MNQATYTALKTFNFIATLALSLPFGLGSFFIVSLTDFNGAPNSLDTRLTGALWLVLITLQIIGAFICFRKPQRSKWFYFVLLLVIYELATYVPMFFR